MEKVCPTCGTEYPANERFCNRDGTALRSLGGGTDLIGSIIAERYHVLKKLGEGGMGQVYLAEHVKMGRKSAVKVMNPGMVHDADAISRFNREAANASRINHPNVAGIYDFGETADGLIYLAMEFIEGESLTALVERMGALPPLRAAEIARQAASGLAQAHDMGIVHRDLKPDNIMIARNRDGSDCVKVVDFGIAKAAGAENQKVTKTGLVVGTPEYMSPEQLAGDKLGAPSDIYSLALVTFNMLTGKLPFAADSAQEAMIMRLTDEPATLASVRPDVAWTPRVQEVMSRALRKLPADRYQRAEEFGRDLYMAVEQMPATSAAEMKTAVIGAATSVMTPPPTRVDASAGAGSVAAPAAPRAVAARKSKVPMFVGGGVAAAALAAAAMFYLPKGAGKTGDVPVTRADSVASAAPASKPEQFAQAPAGANGASGQPTMYSKPIGGTSATSANVAPPVPEKTPGGPNTPVDISSKVAALVSESEEPATAQGAMRRADALLAQAHDESDIVGLKLVRANALGMANEDAKSCAVVATIAERGKDTPWARKVANLADNCAKQ